MEINKNIIKFLDEGFPDKLPLKQISEFELGRLIGNREVIDKLKIKLKIEDKKENLR